MQDLQNKIIGKELWYKINFYTMFKFNMIFKIFI